MPPKRTSTSAAPTVTQDAIRQLVANSVTATLKAQAATMASTSNLNRNTRPRETLVAKRGNYKEFISCQHFYFNGTEGVVRLIRWFEQTEPVFSHSNCAEENKVTFSTGTVTASKPQTLEEAINIAQRMMDKIIKRGSMQGTSDHKRKFDDRRNSNNNNNYPNNHVNNYQINRNNNSNRNNDYRQQQNRRPKTFRSYATTSTKNSRYTGNRPLCKKCTLHYTRPCTIKCNTYNKVGHLTRNCRNKGPTTGSNQQPVLVICHACGEKGHCANQCPKTNNNARGRTYLLRDKNAHRDPNVVTGMFLLNQHLVKLLFDSGADKSFVSISLASILNIPPITLDTTYDIKMANGNLVAQTEAIKEENIKAENLQGMDKAFEICPDGTRCIMNRSWLPLFECQKPSGLLIQPEIPMWKWERMTMDFVSKLPKTSNGHDTLWVLIDRLTKSAHFIPTRATDSMETLTRSYIKEIVSRHRVPISIILNRDSHFTSRFWQSLQNALELRLDDNLNFVEEPVEIMDREVKQLKQSRIPIVKVRWNSKRGPEFTWECEDEIHANYPYLFSTSLQSPTKSRDEISLRLGTITTRKFSSM
nr:reverse transcriptase domain-containing protein [Tanacetum cinerariifolium]